METNKLLTLEEIEKIGSERYPARHGISGDDLEALLATARAYWELKEPAEAPVETVSYRGLGSDEYDQHQRALKEAFEKGRASAERELKDKPHAPTIKAIIEALKLIAPYSSGYYPPNNFIIVGGVMDGIKSLESILKKL